MPQSSIAILALGVVLAACTGCTANTALRPPHSEKTVVATPGIPGGVITTRTGFSARVTSKDSARHRLTLVGADGKPQEVDVPRTVADFARIKAGDIVSVTATEQIVIVICTAMTTVEQGELAVAAQAEKGEIPGAAIASAVQVRSRVSDVDRVQRTVTILTDDGRVVMLPVRADVDMSKHHVGNQVIMRIIRSLEIGVENPNPP